MSVFYRMMTHDCMEDCDQCRVNTVSVYCTYPDLTTGVVYMDHTVDDSVLCHSPPTVMSIAREGEGEESSFLSDSDLLRLEYSIVRHLLRVLYTSVHQGFTAA